MLSAACSALMIGNRCFITDGNDGAGGGGDAGKIAADASALAEKAAAGAKLSADGPTPSQYAAAGYNPASYPPQGYAAKNEDGTLVDPSQVQEQPPQNGSQALDDAPLGDGQGGSAVNGATGAQPLAAAAEAQAQPEDPGAVPGETILGFTIPQIVTFVGMIAGAALPGAQVAGFTIGQLTNLALGVANEVPAAVQAFEEIKAVASSGLPPTAEQWASWNAAADAANARAGDAEDAVINGKGA